MGRIILILLAIIVSAFFVFKAYFFELNGQATIDLFDRLPLFFSTSNITFIFWIFLFGSLFFWVDMNMKKRKTNLFVTKFQTFLFVFAIILQVVSIIQWHGDHFFISILLVMAQLLTLFILYLTYPITNDFLRLRAPIAIYFSWVTFIFFIKVSYLLVYIEWDGFGLSNALWSVIFMTIGVLISLHLRYHHFDISYPLVFIWGYFGIVLEYGFDELLITTAAIFLMGVLAFGTIYFKKNPAKLRR